MNAVSMKDIADRLAISESLVSKVLNDRLGTSRVSPVTAARIRRTSAALGFRKHSGASALARGRHGAMGALVHRHGAPGSMLVEELLDGISTAAAEHQVRLWLQLYSGWEQFTTKAAGVSPNQLDGLIFAGSAHPELGTQLLRWQAQGLPVVTVFANPLEPRLVNLGCSEMDMVAVAVAHLVAQGCRRLVQVGPSPERAVAFKAAHELQLGPWRPAQIIETADWGFADGGAAARRLLNRKVRFDGLVAQCDLLALGALSELLARGVRVPDDVALIGMDDSPLCMATPLPLSSVVQRSRERGRLAIETLARLVNGAAGESLSLPPVLQVRASSWRGSAPGVVKRMTSGTCQRPRPAGGRA